MRRVKKTFIYSKVKIVDKTTKEVLLEDKREGLQDETKVAVDYIKENGYNSNLEITITEVNEIYVMSAEDFMKYGEKIEDEKTLREESVEIERNGE